MMLNEQGSGHRILSDALHRRPGVVKNEQESSHLTRRMRRVRKQESSHCSQTDFILVRREDMHACLDCKVIPEECVVPQHKIVVADFCFRVRFQRSKHVQVSRTKWWKLKEDDAKTFKERVLKEGPWHEGGDANSMWMEMTTCIRKVASEEFGVTKGGKHEAKETWWWNEKVQKSIKEKKE
jgi:hypothetical protein